METKNGPMMKDRRRESFLGEWKPYPDTRPKNPGMFLVTIRLKNTKLPYVKMDQFVIDPETLDSSFLGELDGDDVLGWTEIPPAYTEPFPACGG